MQRNSRSKVLFDYEDLVLLLLLNRERNMTFIKKTMNLSHNSLKIHIDRLSNLNFISVQRGNDDDYKNKYAKITKEGEIIKKSFNTTNVQSFLVSTILVGLSIQENLPKDVKDELKKMGIL